MAAIALLETQVWTTSSHAFAVHSSAAGLFFIWVSTILHMPRPEDLRLDGDQRKNLLIAGSRAELLRGTTSGDLEGICQCIRPSLALLDQIYILIRILQKNCIVSSCASE